VIVGIGLPQEENKKSSLTAASAVCRIIRFQGTYYNRTFDLSCTKNFVILCDSGAPEKEKVRKK
jgi:hypothetical protein